MMRIVIVALCLLPALPSQSTLPAPVGETQLVLTAREAHAFAFCQQLAAMWGRRAVDDWRTFAATPLPGYRLLRAEPDPQGRLDLVDLERNEQRALVGGACLTYLVPIEVDDTARHIFCVRGDGVAAFTGNTTGNEERDSASFAPDAALGQGGGGTLRDFPRTPTRGRDGNFWQPFAMLPQVELRLMVVDERGEPMPMAVLACAPAEQEHLVDALLPAGSAQTTMEGDATISGAPARGLGFVLRRDRREIWLSPDAVEVHGRSARLTVSRAMLRVFEVNANESAAIATLKNISSAQAQCQASGVIDQNQNGRGEYGTFAELAGVMTLRGGTEKMSPPVLSRGFAEIKGGIVVRSGYCFRIFLPGKAAEPIGENVTGGAIGLAIEPGLAEVLWCAYAWPLEAGESGQRVFFINQHGDVLSAPNTDNAYSGRMKAPQPDAAFDPAGSGKLDAKNTFQAAGSDGQQWVVIG